MILLSRFVIVVTVNGVKHISHLSMTLRVMAFYVQLAMVVVATNVKSNV